MHNLQVSQSNSFLSGIKQRLLSFVFRAIWNEETDETQVGFCKVLWCILWIFFNVSPLFSATEGPVLEEEIPFPFSRLC